MSLVATVVLAALSVWDYPARQPQHEQLRGALIVAMRQQDVPAMEKITRQATNLLPEDPIWRYNLACTEARLGHREAAFVELERAIRYGYRAAASIEDDSDFKAFADEPKFKELVELAGRLQDVPLTEGPNAYTAAKGKTGGTVVLGERNLTWDLESGCFVAHLELSPEATGGNVGDLYFNRDLGHSDLKTADFPGITRVTLDAEGRKRGFGTDVPDMLFPCPVFGNCSRAITEGPYWRSMPRMMMTRDAPMMSRFCKQYLSNQVWVFPAVNDHPPLGTFGDLFASVTPYWIITQGKSWSDQYYLRAALEVSRSLPREVKREAVARGLLAPTVQAVMRKALRGVKSEEAYLTPAAHPTAFPAQGLELGRLRQMAAALTVETLPPIATITGLAATPTAYRGKLPEITYASPCAWAFVLRGDEEERSFLVRVSGGAAYTAVQVHGRSGAAAIERVAADQFKVTVRRSLVSPTERVDVALFARSEKSGWGAPTFLSFATVESVAAYVDPILAGAVP